MTRGNVTPLLAIALTLLLSSTAFARGTHTGGAGNYWQGAAANWGTAHCRQADTSGCVPRGAGQPAGQPAAGTYR